MNAEKHGNGLAGLELVLGQETAYSPAGIRVLVSDFAPDVEPRIESPGALSERGRGLELVVALSLRWGWHRLRVDQKQVWCKLPLE
ncbi:hypothetical protein N566_26125 [Streptomycetaceae bacterium MP113-05]|nr:hypothetical protein N566_26125 [Streptomycetaceae bacterium MP113-05]